MSQLLEKVAELASQAALVAGCELVHVAYSPGGRYTTLQIFVDRDNGGPTIDDCSTISRQLGDFLELQEVMPGRYQLEVSSPGLDRPLKTHDPKLSRANFVRFVGKLAIIKTTQPLLLPAQPSDETSRKKVRKTSGRKVFKGYLQGMEADDVLIQVDDELQRIPLDWISKAHLEFEF